MNELLNLSKEPIAFVAGFFLGGMFAVPFYLMGIQRGKIRAYCEVFDLVQQTIRFGKRVLSAMPREEESPAPPEEA